MKGCCVLQVQRGKHKGRIVKMQCQTIMVDRPGCWFSRHSNGRSCGIACVRCCWHASLAVSVSQRVLTQNCRKPSVGSCCSATDITWEEKSRFCWFYCFSCSDWWKERRSIRMERGHFVRHQYWGLLCFLCRYSAAAGGKVWLCALLNRNSGLCIGWLFSGQH